MSADVRTVPPGAAAGEAASRLEQALRASASNILYLLFVLSGAAGLIYESIWARYLGLFLGHSAYAQVLVLAIFLGGMSAGAVLAGRRSEQLARPLLWYAAVELAAGLIGLVFHNVYTATTGFALDVVFPALNESPRLLLIAKWTIGAALILPQSLLLGATFPLMSAGVVRHLRNKPGRIIAALYFANSIGAAAGVLLSGFWLIPLVGLPGTVLTAAAANVVVAVAAYLIGRALPVETALAAAAPDRSTADSRPVSRRRLSTLLLAVAFGTAVASFIYEITWIRMLSLVLGSATHSFELMLSAFILGLALGALCVRPAVDRDAFPLRTLAQVQWAMGAFALATLPVYVASFGWTVDLLQTFARTAAGYHGFNLARYALCLAVMLPATFCAGMTLPLLSKSLLTNGWGERAIGAVYAVNTLGSIVGVVLAGLVLMPVLGLQTLLILGAAIDMALGVMLFAASGATPAAAARRALVAGSVTAAVALAVGSTTTLDASLLNSGVFRTGRLPQPGAREMRFHRDGRTATVAVFHTPATGFLTVATNGKPDASLSDDWFGDPLSAPKPLQADSATQVLVALTSIAHHPNIRSAALVGFGSGVTSHFLLASPAIERLTTVEIEPAMVQAAREFYPANRRAFDDPRSRVIIDDAKSFFAASPERFDLILSEPSNPWVSGIASLFGEEFYDVVQRRLADGGIFAQWLHLYEINDGLVLSVFKALHEHFADYAVYVVGFRDVLIVATNGGTLGAPDWSVFGLPDIQVDLGRFVPFAPEAMDSTRFLRREALAPLLARGFPSNSDFFPILDVGAEQARFLIGAADGFIGLSTDRFPAAGAGPSRRPPASETSAPVTPEPLFEGRARAGRLRAALASGDFRSVVADRADAPAGKRLWAWSNLVAADRPPADWQSWMADTIAIENDLHVGSAGMVDEQFYATARGYLGRHGAPPEAIAALGFVEALGRWDFPTAAALTDQLLPAARDGHHWVPAHLLLDGGVIAKLRQRDVEGAREVRDTLTRASGRPPGDLRRLLLDAYLAHPDAIADR
jgi:predicted membrane-bound spermidine synthase